MWRPLERLARLWWEEMMMDQEDRETRLRKFTEETGWVVSPGFLHCWHAAVGRKCPDRKSWATCRTDHINRQILLTPRGPADHWHTNPLDHPRAARTPNGEQVLLCSPYVLDQRGAAALSDWCLERGLTWSAVPAGWYWPGVALSIIIRNSDKEPHNWVPDPIRWERYAR